MFCSMFASDSSLLGTGSPGCFSAQWEAIASSVIMLFSCSTACSLLSASTVISWPQVQVMEYLFIGLCVICVVLDVYIIANFCIKSKRQPLASKLILWYFKRVRWGVRAV